METVVKEKKPLGSMAKRALTSTVYLIVWILLGAMKWCVPHSEVNGVDVYWGSLGFDAAFCVISVLTTLEFLRAIDGSDKTGNSKISTPQRAITVAFAAITVPLYVLVQITMDEGLLAIACAFIIYFMFLAVMSVFDHSRSTVKGTISCVFCMLYCGLLSTMLSAVNHFPQNSMAAILVLFLCTTFTDTGAFLIGSLLKKWIPAKLAPQLSPNKTIIGAVGGIIGGILGGIVAYYIITLLGGYNGVGLTFTSDKIHPLVTFILVGLCTSVLAQIGDLFESAIKRECGLKDMGNILPGHGGMLDRFDSMLYCNLVVLLAFGTIII